MNNGYFEIFVGTSPKNAEISLQLIVDECHRLVSEGATESEVTRGKSSSRGQRCFPWRILSPWLQ